MRPGSMVELSDLRNRMSSSVLSVPARVGSADSGEYTNLSRRDEDEIERAADEYPRLVPDAVKYGGGGDEEGPHFCSVCCALFSLFAVIFLGLVGKIFDGQSIYVLVPEGTDLKKAGGNAFGAAACYAVTFGISCFYWWTGRSRLRRGGEEEDNGGWRSMED